MTIYGLADPRTGLVRYVGSTKNLRRRVAQHMQGRDGSREKVAWLLEILALGLEPVVMRLEECGAGAAASREQHWMSIHKGALLLNRHWNVKYHSTSLLRARLRDLTRVFGVARLTSFLDISPHHLTRLQKGLCRVPSDVLVKVSLRLGCPPDTDNFATRTEATIAEAATTRATFERIPLRRTALREKQLRQEWSRGQIRHYDAKGWPS